MEEHTSAVSGVSSEGFMTMVQPTANAGATFHALRDVFKQRGDHKKGINSPHVDGIVPRNAVSRGESMEYYLMRRGPTSVHILQ